MNTTSTPKFVRWALMLGIMVILNVFFFVLTALAFPEPKFEDFCPAADRLSPQPINKETCEAVDGVWNPTAEYSPKTEAAGYCDLYAKCQKPYDTAREDHALKAFVLMIGLGLVALVVGLMPLGSSMVASGLSYGGVLAFVIGSMSYWGTASNWVRLAIAGVGLVALLVIGLKRFKD